MANKRKKSPPGKNGQPPTKKKLGAVASNATPPGPISTQPTSVSSSQPQQGKPIEDKAKPITISTNYSVINNFVNNLQLKSKPLIKILNANQVQLICESADKSQIVSKLKSQSFAFHSYTEKSERKFAAVLKGYFRQSTELMIKTLTENGVSAQSVTFISQSEDRPIYLVHFPPGSTNLHELNAHHRYIDNIVIRWEAIKKNSKRAVQCGNCKRWGHTSANCGYPFRCIKCKETHERGECKRETRENTSEDSVFCVNCTGDHPANSSICPAFKDYLSKRKPKLKSRQSTVLPRNPASNANDWPELEQDKALPSQRQASRNFTPRERASYAESVGRKYNRLNEVSGFIPDSLDSASQRLLASAMATLQSQFEGMIKALNDTFSSLVQQLATLHGHT
jgi:hypothetical protein